MATIINKGNSALSVANDFYRVEASAIGAYSATVVSTLTAGKSQAMTFANAGNLLGVAIALYNTTASTTASTLNNRGVTLSFQEIKGSCTMDVTTDKVTYASHGLNNGDTVAFSTSGTLPTNCVIDTVYYVVNKGTNDFQISLTAGGAAINLTGSNGTGHVLWVEKRSKTLTVTQLWNTTDRTGLSGMVPFPFASSYAVDTTAGKYRICVIQTGGTAGTWNWVGTTVSTVPYNYAAWSDTTVSFTDSDVVLNNPDYGTLTLDGTHTITTLVTMRNIDPTVANVCSTILAPSADITLSSTYLFSSHSGIRCGTSASRNTYANQVKLRHTLSAALALPFVGTSTIYQARNSFQLYGELPAYPRTTLSAAAPAGGTATMTIADPCVVTFTAHTFSDGQPVTFYTAGALPTGITANTVIYYARPSDTATPANQFWLYDTRAHALAGGATGRVATSGTQSGTHTVSPCIETTDTTGWPLGAEIAIGGADSTSSISDTYAHRTITAIDGTIIGLSVRLGVARLSGHYVTSPNCGYGIQIIGNLNSSQNYYFYGPSNLVLDGVEMSDIAGFITGVGVGWNHEDSTARSKFYVTNCSMWTRSGGSARSLLGTLFVQPDGFEVSNNNFSMLGSLFATSAYYLPNGTGKSGELLFNNNLMINGSSYIGFAASSTPTIKYRFTNNIIENGGTVGYFNFNGLGCEISGNRIFGCSATSGGYTLGGLNFQNMFNAYGSGNRMDKCAIGMLYHTGSMIGNVLTDNIYGSEKANTSDIGVIDGIYFDHDEISPTGAVTFDTTYLSQCIAGSEFKVDGYNDTVGDVRSWKPEGTLVSSSGKIVGRTIDSTLTLTNTYNLGSDDVTGIPCAAIVNVLIANSAYYGVTHELPKLTVTFDGTDTEVDTASASTSQQKLIVPFTPTTSYEAMSVALTQKTDSTGSNADVTWDTLDIITRKYGNVYTRYSKAITQTTKDTIYTIPSATVNPFITVSNSATVAGYSEFTIDHAAQTITITADTTMARLYDYTQYDIGLEANYGYMQWFTTIDGVNFTSTYDIILNTGVDLTGGGTIDVGANSFTKTGTATYDGIIITSTDRKVHVKLNTLVAGSTVYLYNSSDSSEIYKDVVAGTSLDYIFDYTADKNILIRVRKAGYLSYETTGTITSTGFSINVGQSVDSVYVANGIDGSTVTEFSLSEGVVGIFIDDPDNATTGQRLYNWYRSAISSITYIDDQDDLITAQTAWSYVLDDTILLKNEDLSNPCFITGANINNSSSTGQVIDTTGGSININGYFPFNSAEDVADTVKALTTNKFLALK